ncbi:MAG TPA: hypothetical protein VGI81_23340, partial [Tepidisphaeraceae bacterium]
FGALSTLPLYCLGDLPSPDPGQIIGEHYDVWRSCLIVARETLRSSIDATASAHQSLNALLAAADNIRGRFSGIATSLKSDPTGAAAAYARLSEAYWRLPDLNRNLANELGIDCSFLP